MTRSEPWKSLNAAVKRRSVVLAGGQDKLAGKVFRVGHLGSMTVAEILGTVAAAQQAAVDAYGATRTAAVPA